MSHRTPRVATSTPTQLRVDNPVIDLGLVLSTGQELRHVYLVKNLSEDAITFQHGDAVVPCCSSIGPLPAQVLPGETVEIPVQFRPGYDDAEKRLTFTVETEPSDASFGLSLTARIRSSWKVIEREGDSRRVAIGDSGRRRYKIVCRSRGEDGLPLPESIAIASPLQVRTFDRTTASAADIASMTESSCEVEVTIPAGFEVGTHHASLTCRWPGRKPLEQIVAWEVTPRIRATPSGLVLKPGDTHPEVKVRVESKTAPFRIVKITGPIVVESEKPSDENALIHSINLQIDRSLLSGGQSGGNDIVLHTDDPNQPETKISVLALP